MKYRVIIFLLFILISNVLGQEKDQQLNGDTILASLDTTIWTYLAARDSAQWTVTKADSEKAFKEYFYKGYTIYRNVDKIFQRIDKGRTTYANAVPELSKQLPQVRDLFEGGLKLNPFDSYLRQAIVSVYYKLFTLYAFQKDDIGRLQILHNLVQVQKDRKTRIQLFDQLGKIYFKYQMWEQAKNNFRLAVDTIFEGEESEIDSTQLYYDIYYRGQAYVKLYHADSALISIVRARMIAPSEKEYQQLTDLIDYINWDQGNLYASEKYLETRILASKKQYAEAEKAYLDLIDIINTDRARGEVNLKLSVIQFNQFQKHDEAINRLWQVVNKIPQNPLPDSSAYVNEQEYWDSYGFMCTQLANKNYTDNRKLAFLYFAKASQVDCPDRSRAFLGLATLSMNNPEVCIDYCNKALQFEFQLTEQEKKNLYNLLYLSYSRVGEFAESRKWYKKYRSI